MDHAEALHLRRDRLTACTKATGGLLEAADVIHITQYGPASNHLGHAVLLLI